MGVINLTEDIMESSSAVHVSDSRRTQIHPIESIGKGMKEVWYGLLRTYLCWP
jgi:hypothetical protein